MIYEILKTSLTKRLRNDAFTILHPVAISYLERNQPMNTSSLPSGNNEPRDAVYWAQQISTLKVARTPTGALNLNVEGREALSPLQGFGQMWQKTYQVRLQGIHVKTTEVIKTW